MEFLQIIDPLGNFLNMAYILCKSKGMQSNRSQMLFKIVILKVSQISLENNYVGVSFNKVGELKAWNFIEKDSNTGVFLCTLRNF